MKRIIAFALSILMLLSILVGCANTAEPATSPSDSISPESSAPASAEPSTAPSEPGAQLSEEAPPPSEEAPPADEPEPEEEGWVYAPLTYPLTETVEVFTCWSIFELSPGCKMTDINDHPQLVTSAEKTGVTIEMKTVSQATGTELTNLMIASGDYTDLLAGYSFTSGIDAAIDDEIIINLRPLLQENAPDYWNLLMSDNNIKDVATDEGNIGLFSGIGMGRRGPDSGIQIRKDWLDALGLDVPNTYDEYAEVLEAIMVNYDVDIPFYLPQDGVMENNQLAAGYGVALKISDMGGTKGFYQVDGEIKYGYAEPGFIEYITMMNDWYNKGLINSSFLSALPYGVDGNLVTKVLGGRVGVYSLFNGLIDMFTNNNEDPEAEFVAVPDAVKNIGDQTHLGNADTAPSGSTGLMMMSTCKNPELLTQWANYWYTEEGQMYSQWGYLGTTYEIGVDGLPYYTEFMTKNEDGLLLSEMKMEWTGLFAFLTDNSQPEASLSQNAQDAQLIWAQDKDGAYELPGSLTLTVDEGTRLNNLFSDISTYCLENTSKFIIGERPLSELEDFQQMLQTLKVQECCDIYKAAYDRYLVR